MSIVDNRVVRMTFDNAQFERGIKETQKTLQDFEKSLKLDGAAAGFNNLSKAADTVNLSGLGRKAKSESDKIGEAAKDAESSIRNISSVADGSDFSGLGKNADKASRDVVDASVQASDSISRIDDVADNTDFSGLSNAAWNAAFGINDASSSVDMSYIYDGAMEASEGFSIFEEIATGAIRRVGEYITDFVTGGLSSIGDTIKKYTLDPIKEGFSEYQTQIGSIQTIMANTNRDFDSASDIDEVNDALNILNKYADETIYKFTDMTEAIGTFTAAGLDLNQAVDAVKGAANVAAFSGASTSDFHRVLPQLAQALSAGTVGLQDWRSVEVAHMASAKFVEAIGDMAVHMAKVNKAGNEAAEAGQALINKELNMRQALNKSTSKDMAGWFSSDILSETLRVFTFDIRKASAEERKAMEEYLAQLGYQADEFQAVFDRAAMATRAATEVRTWNQLWDTLGEAIGSNWTGIWTNLLGDFRQATNTFTFISQQMSGAIDSFFSGIVNAAQMFNGSGAYKLIFGDTLKDAEGNVERVAGAIDSIALAIGKPLKAIKDAFDEIFGLDNDTLSVTIVSFANAFKDFADSLVISDDAATGLRQIFEGIFSVLDLGIQVVLDIGAAFGSLLDCVRTITDPLLDIAAAIGGQVGKVVVWFHDRILDIRAAVIESLSPIASFIDKIKNFIRELFGIASIPDKIQNAGDAIIAILDTIWDFVDIPELIKGISKTIQDLINFISEAFGIKDFIEGANEQLDENGNKLSLIDRIIRSIMSNPLVSFLSSVFDQLKVLTNPIRDIISNIFNFEDIEGSITLPKILGKVKDSIISFAEGIGNAFPKTKETLFKIFDGIKNKFGEISKLFTGSNFKKVLSSIKSFCTTTIQNVKNVYEYLKNTKIGQGISESIEGLKKTFSDLNIFENIVNSIKTVMDSGLPAIYNIIKTGVDNITGFLAPIWERSNTLPEFFVNLFIEIGNAIKNGLLAIKDAIINFKPEDLFKAWTVVSDTISEIIKTWFPNISKYADEALKGITSFFSSTIGDAKNWGEAISNVAVSIGNAILDIPNTLMQILGFFDETAESAGLLGDKIEGTSDQTADSISSIPEKINEVGGNIGDGFKGLLDKISSFVGPMVTPFQNFATKAKEAIGFLNDHKSVTKGIKDGGLFGGTVAWFNLEIGNLEKFLITSSEKVTKIFEVAGDQINNGSVTKFVELIDAVLIGKLISAIKDFINSFKGVADSIKSLNASIAKYFNRVNVETMSQKLKNIAIAIGIVTASLFVISKIENPEKAVIVLGAVAGCILIMQAISALLTKFCGGGAGDQLVKTASTFGVFGISLLIAMFSISKLSQFDWKANEVGLKAAVACLAVLAILTALMTRIGGGGGQEIIKASVGMMILIAALGMLPPVLEKFTAFMNNMHSIEDVVKYIGSLAILMIAMGTALKIAGNDAIKAGIGLILLGAAISIIIEAIQPLLSIDQDTLATVFGALITLIGEFGVMVKTLKAGDMAKAGAALLIFAASVTLISYSLKELATSSDLGNIAAAAAGIAAIIGIYMKMAKAFQKPADFIKISAGMLIFSVGVGVMAASLWLLAQQPWESIAAAAAGIAAITLAVGKLSQLNGNNDLIKTALGFDVFAVGVVAISFALAHLATLDAVGLIASASALAILALAFGKMSQWANNNDIIKMSLAFVIFAAGIDALAYGLYQLQGIDPLQLAETAGALSIFALAFIALANATKSIDLMTTAAGFVIFAAGIDMLAFALYNLQGIDPVQLAATAGALSIFAGAFLILAKFTDGLDLAATAVSFVIFAAGIDVLAISLYALQGIDVGQLQAMTMCLAGLSLVLLALTLAGPEILVAAVAFDAFSLGMIGLAFALTMVADLINNFPSFEAFYNVGYNIIGGLAAGIADGVVVLIKSIIDIPRKIIAYFCEALGIHSPSDVMADEVGQYIPAGIAEGITNGEGDLDGALSGMMDGMFNNLADGLSSGEGGLSTLLDGMMNNIFDNISTSAGNFVSGIPDWVATNGIPMLQQALTDFWNWFTTDGIAMIGQALSDFWNWFTTDGIRMIGEALAAFWDWFITVGLPGIVDMIGKLFELLGELLSKFWDWFTTEGLPMIGQALQDLAHWFFTVAIPKIAEFIATILAKLAELAAEFLKWLFTDGIRMLAEALGTFVKWAFTEFLPSLLQFIADIFAKLGEIPGMLLNWVQTEALPAIGDGIKSMMDEAAKIGGKIIEWAKGIPGYIADGIAGIWQELLNAGINMAKGIAEGLEDGVQWIINAVTGLGQDALDAIKNFFGIASPSKTMRDEVGRYLSEGVASGILLYSNVAEAAAVQMGQNTIAGVQSVLDNASYTITNPKITPVINSNAFNESLNSIPLSTDANINGQFSTKAKLTGDLLSKGFLGALDMLMASIETNSSSQVNSFNASLESNTTKLYDLIKNNSDSVKSSIDDNANKIYDSFGDYSNRIVDELISLKDSEKEYTNNILEGIAYTSLNMANNTGYLQSISANVFSISEDVHQIREGLNGGMNLVLDGNSVADAVTPRIDNNLGQRQVAAEREMM